MGKESAKRLIQEDRIEELVKQSKTDLNLQDLKEVLRPDGWTIAHEMAKRGYEFTNKAVLKIADCKGWTVAHVMARRGYKFTDKDVLKLADAGGWTVAHTMAEQGYEFDDEEILKTSNVKGWTVAHVMAKCGYKFTDKRILKWADCRGWTVAHEAVIGRCTFEDKDRFELLDGKFFYKVVKLLRTQIPIERLRLTDAVFLANEAQSEKTVVVKSFNKVALKLKSAINL